MCVQKYKAPHHAHIDAIKMTAVKWSVGCPGWGGRIKISTQLRRMVANSWLSPTLQDTYIYFLIFPWCGIQCFAGASLQIQSSLKKPKWKGGSHGSHQKKVGDFNFTRCKGDSLDAGLQNWFKDIGSYCCVSDKSVMFQCLLGVSQDGNNNN